MQQMWKQKIEAFFVNQEKNITVILAVLANPY